jgi:hypothetical protein
MAAEALTGSDKWFRETSRGNSPLLTTIVDPSESVDSLKFSRSCPSLQQTDDLSDQ